MEITSAGLAGYCGTIYAGGVMMAPEEIRKRRLHNQQLLNPSFTDAAEVVSRMAAMQAQEYAMAKWAIGLRMRKSSDETVEKAFNDGKILRTHTMRPTWHFIANEDMRWMLDITAPRVIALNAFMYKKLELDNSIFNKSFTILEKILRDSTYLTRDEIKGVLVDKGIECDGMRAAHIMMQAELTGLVCSGPRKGNRFTYALIGERAPKPVKLSREEGLRELCLRYFTSRGPATVKDFANWSGLTIKDVREGIAMLDKELDSTTIEGVEYYFSGEKPLARKSVNFLMPDYDEYGMGYKDRSALINPESGGNKSQFDRVVIVDGMIAGKWRRTIKKDTIQLELQLFKPHSVTDSSITMLVKDFGEFLGKKIEIT